MDVVGVSFLIMNAGWQLFQRIPLEVLEKQTLTNLASLQIVGTTVKNQVFGEMDTFNPSQAFSQVKWDGILGMGWPALATKGHLPVFFNMISQKLVSDPSFSFLLTGYVA